MVSVPVLPEVMSLVYSSVDFQSGEESGRSSSGGILVAVPTTILRQVR